MLKKVILIASSTLLVILSQAQSLSALGKGKKITRTTSIKTKSNTEMMGQSMEQAQTMNLKGEITIADINDKEVFVEEVTKKMKLNMEVMGEEIEYDSEKPNKKEELQRMGEMLNKPTIFTYNLLGIIADIKYDKTIEEQMKASASMGLGMAYSIGEQVDFLLTLPKDAIVGKSWVVTLTIDGKKKDNNYTIKSIENGIVKVELVSNFSIDKKTEINGNEMSINQTGTINATLLVDAKTNLVKTATTKTSSKGTMSVMGQSVPMEMEVIKEDMFE